MSAMVSKNDGSSATSNLINLGYYKEDFIEFINDIKFNNSELLTKECLLLINKYSKKASQHCGDVLNSFAFWNKSSLIPS